MAKRRRLPAAHIIRSNVVALRDRTAVPPNPKLDPTTSVITGPDGKDEEVYRARRNDPLADFLARGDIDETQAAAGREWRGVYERAQLGVIRAIDTTRDVVDGGKLFDPLSMARAKALDDLNAASAVMGKLAGSVVYDVLVRGLSARQIAAIRGFDDEQSRRFYNRTFREALGELAIFFGLMSPSRASKRGA